MRYFPLVFPLMLTLIAGWSGPGFARPTSLQAQTASGDEGTIEDHAVAQASGAEAAIAPQFWPQAQRLTQRQMYLVNRIEAASSGFDSAQLQVVRGQLTLHLGEIDQFLAAYYDNPEPLCSARGGDMGATFPFVSTAPSADYGVASTLANLSQPQAQVYCSLYSSSRRLASLTPLLLQRQARMADAAIPASGGPAQTVGLTLPASGAAPADRVRPRPQAIAPPPQISNTLQISQQFLARAEAAFPASVEFIDPQAVAEVDWRNTYGVHPQERQQYADLIAQPQYGIARVLTADRYQQVGYSSAQDQDLFAALPSTSTSYVPRLMLQIQEGKLEFIQPQLDYGFITDLGDVPLESLPQGDGLGRSPLIPNLFLAYRPPSHLGALQAEQQQFTPGLSELNGEAAPDAALTQAEVMVNHTYLVRSLQFQLPELITSGRPLLPYERRYLNLLLEMQSSDLLLAVRPVNRRPDGSYTVLWRVLAELPAPHIADLDTYVRFF